MDNIRPLTLLLRMCTFIQVVMVLIIGYSTFGVIMWHMSPTFFQGLTYEIVLNFSFYKILLFSVKDQFGSEADLLTIDKITPFSLYLIYFQIVSVLVFVILSTKHFKQIVQSVMKRQSFLVTNIGSFKNISKYAIIVFLITSFHWMTFTNGNFFSFQVNLLPLFISLITFALSEVFKEGNLLLEENRSTI